MSETRLNATRTILMSSFMKNVKKDDYIFNFLSKLGCCSQEYKSRKIHRNLVNPEVIIAPTKTGKTQIFIAKFPKVPDCIFRGNGIERRSNRSQSRSQESPSVSRLPGLQQLVRFSLLVSEKTSSVNSGIPSTPASSLLPTFTLNKLSTLSSFEIFG